MEHKISIAQSSKPILNVPVKWFCEIRLEMKRAGMTATARQPFQEAFAAATRTGGVLVNHLDRLITRTQFEQALKICHTSNLTHPAHSEQPTIKPTPEPAWMGQLRFLNNLHGRLEYTGPKDACTAGAKFWPGSKIKRVGINEWHLYIPEPLFMKNPVMGKVAV
jgi:hypothetical protein